MDEYYKLEPQLLCCKLCRDMQSWRFAELSAPHWRFYWNLRGSAEVRFANGDVVLDDRSYLLIPPNTSFGTRDHGPTDHLYIHFLVKAPYDRVGRDYFEVEPTPRSTRHLREIVELLDTAARPGLRLSMLCYALLVDALLEVPEDALAAGHDNPRIVKVVEHMEAHLKRNVANHELSRVAGMNVNAFVKFFAEKTGLTPQRYLANLRVERACVLLRFTEMSLEEVSEATGFCDRYHLSRVFKRGRGMSPVKFRKLDS